MADILSSLRAFIPANTPIGKAGGADMLLRVTGGNVLGAATLAAIAKAESGFGANVGRFTNNAFGYGVHEGPSVYTSPSWEAGAAKVWKSLNSGLYKGSGYRTLPKIIQRYVTGADGNDMGAYTRNTSSWLKSIGVDPNADIFSGQVVPTQPAAGGPVGAVAPQVTGTRVMPGGSTVPVLTQPRFQLTPEINRDIARYLVASRENVFSGGQAGAPNILGIVDKISKLQRAAVAPAQEAVQSTNATLPGVTNLQGTVGVAPGGLPGLLAQQDPGKDGLYGFRAGGVDSGLAFRGGTGGDWGGSMPRALALARAVGADPSSEKRSRKLTASGGVSDHWVGSTNSYATDLPTSGAAGDALFKRVAQALGVSLKSGQWNNVNIGGYRYQVGWRVPGHYDHVHVGVKKL